MLSVEHLIDMNDLTAQDISCILDHARSFAEINRRSIKKVPTLRGKTIVNMFMEPSTRTRSSFELAEKRLSADSLNFSPSSSAVKKGETLKDTTLTLDAMGIDAIVIRHRYAGSPYMLTQYTNAKIINAGDGKHQHPTQALLDLYTMREHFGSLEGLRVGIVGDVVHSRVLGSLAPALKKMGAQVVVVGPPTFMPARPDILGVECCSDFNAVLPSLDVVYMLRIQLERVEGAPIPSLREYNMLFGLDLKRELLLKKHCLVMHPGPMNRGVEISTELADGERSCILEQVSAGVAVRMAVMYLLLGGEDGGSLA